MHQRCMIVIHTGIWEDMMKRQKNLKRLALFVFALAVMLGVFLRISPKTKPS